MTEQQGVWLGVSEEVTGALCAVDQMLHASLGAGECVAGILEVTGVTRPGCISLRFTMSPSLGLSGKKRSMPVERNSSMEGGLYGLVCVLPGLWGYCHHD